MKKKKIFFFFLQQYETTTEVWKYYVVKIKPESCFPTTAFLFVIRKLLCLLCLLTVLSWETRHKKEILLILTGTLYSQINV